MRNLKSLLLVLCVPILSNCGFEETERIRVIDVTKVLYQPREISLSHLASDVEYIQLETTENSLINKRLRLFANEDNIVAISYRQILVFERKTGRFLREISNYGRNPGSYMSTIDVLPFEEETNTIYARGNSKKLEFSLKGDLKNEIVTPENSFTTAKINDENYVGYALNYNGNEKVKLVIFDSLGNVIQTFPNYLVAPKSKSIHVYKPNGWFYKYNSQLYFCEQFNDTLFHITAEGISPRYVLSRGKFSPPYNKQTVGFPMSEYFMYNHIYESERFLFYTFDFEKEKHTAVFDKSNMEVMVGDYSQSDGSGFTNDMAGFFPMKISSINNNNELIGFLEAHEIIQWFDDNPQLVKELPKELRTYQKMSESDNPVVIIAKLSTTEQ
ncbi:MAG: 6-bladed beta-propeller [Cyclobacteriaceae bacterium]